MTKIPLTADSLADALAERNRRCDRESGDDADKIVNASVDLANQLLHVISPDSTTTGEELSIAFTALSMVVGRLIVSTANAEPEMICAGITDFLGALLANSDVFIAEELKRRAMN